MISHAWFLFFNLLINRAINVPVIRLASTGPGLTRVRLCSQVTAITTSAEYCEQRITYSCRMSRLLNTPGNG